MDINGGQISHWLFWGIVLFPLFSISAQQIALSEADIQTGDLLFYGDESALSKAIDQVTRVDEQVQFSHVGVAEAGRQTVWVIHSLPGKGVVRESLASFVAGSASAVWVYRATNLSNGAKRRAVQVAQRYLSQPYNYTYVMDDYGIYCSELIYYAFSKYSLFELKPMTFNDPGTGMLHPQWKVHYEKLGIEVPEGLPGCNPNAMAASKALSGVGYIQKKEPEK